MPHGPIECCNVLVRDNEKCLATLSWHTTAPKAGKLVAKIRRWEFVEMGELLPEFWASPRDAEGDPTKEQRLRQARKVTEIFTWDPSSGDSPRRACCSP